MGWQRAEGLGERSRHPRGLLISGFSGKRTDTVWMGKRFSQLSHESNHLKNLWPEVARQDIVWNASYYLVKKINGLSLGSFFGWMIGLGNDARHGHTLTDCMPSAKLALSLE